MLSFQAAVSSANDHHAWDDIVPDCNSLEDVVRPSTITTLPNTHTSRPQIPTSSPTHNSNSNFTTTTTTSSSCTSPCSSSSTADPYSLLPAEMRSEQARLQTFHTWSDTSTVRRLSRHGFYVSQEGNCLRCAFCGLEVCDVSPGSGSAVAQDVKRWHWQVSGKDCPLLIRSQSSARHSTPRPRRDAEETVVKVVHSEYRSNSNSSSSRRSSSSRLPKEKVVSSAIHTRHHYHHHHHHHLRHHHDHRLQSPTGQPAHELMFKPATTGTPGEVLDEGRRQPVSEQKYATREDASRSLWQLDSSPTTSQTTAPPTVSQLRDSAVDSPSSSPASPPPSSSSSSSSPSSSTPSPAPAKRTPVWADIVRTARIPPMVAYQARLQTFASWPLLSPTPRELARAGFYRDTATITTTSTTTTNSNNKYSPSSSSSSSAAAAVAASPVSRSLSGDQAPPACSPAAAAEAQEDASPRTPHGRGSSPSSSSSSARPSGADNASGATAVRECRDSVRCFWCGERVHRWQRSDDPALEHARLSPDCRYVMQLLGPQLHRDVIIAASTSSGAGR